MSMRALVNRYRTVSPDIPPLMPGDRLKRDEFHRRYEAMPNVKKAELVEGVVYMPWPVPAEGHAVPHVTMVGWHAYYRAFTPGVQAADNATVLLDLDNEPQPDALMRILPAFGDGHYQSTVFPGLWLDPAALIRGDGQQLIQVLQQGLATPQHAEFVQRLEAARCPQ